MISWVDVGFHTIDKLKTRLKETIHKAFSHRNYGSKFVVLGYNSTYFSNKIQKGKTCYSEEQVISMLEFLIDNIFVSFGWTLFQQVVGISMGTNCAPFLADLFSYSYESEFLQKLVKDKKIHEARAFKQCPSKGDKYAIDEELHHTDQLFFGVACFTFLNFV
jgi:hypothetical protein